MEIIEHIEPGRDPPTPMSADPFAEHVLGIGRRKDRESFRLLFEHFAGKIKSLHMRRGITEAQAEELAQDAMLTVWRKADQFDPGRATVAAWIYTIARNLWVDSVRRERISQYLYVEQAVDPMTPENEFEGAEANTAVRRALGDLPAEQAQVLRMSFFEDRTHEQIAVALRLPIGTVKSRIRLAAARLRPALRTHR